MTGIKIDVEGADIAVLQGALDTLRVQYPLVLTETRPDQRLFRIIRPLEYRTFAFVKSAQKARFAFSEIGSESKLHTKMLFLVPPRLQKQFESLSLAKAAETAC